MFQRDYMMRMIEQVGEAVAQAIGLRRRKEHIEALRLIDDLFDRHLRLHPSLVRSLSDEDLVRLMTTSGVVDTANVEAAALMLKETGEIYDEQAREADSYAARVKSLSLYVRLALLDGERVFAASEGAVGELLGKLASYELPAAVKRLLIQMQIKERRYDEAENLLHELLEDGAADAAEAERFYRELLRLPDGQLAEGGLPRGEIEQGLADLDQFKGVR